MPETPGPRSCLDCGADISHRGNRAKRCEACAETARKVVHAGHSKAWRERYPEQVVTYGLRYRLENPGRPLRGDPEKRAATLRAWRRRNAARRRTQARAWRAANPETMRRYRHEQREARRDAVQRRRARKAALPYEPIVYRHLAVRDHWTCQLCHEAVDPTIVHPDLMSGSVDHVVPISKGGPHLYGNVQLAHLTCNLAKGDR